MSATLRFAAIASVLLALGLSAAPAHAEVRVEFQLGATQVNHDHYRGRSHRGGHHHDRGPRHHQRRHWGPPPVRHYYRGGYGPPHVQRICHAHGRAGYHCHHYRGRQWRHAYEADHRRYYRHNPSLRIYFN